VLAVDYGHVRLGLAVSDPMRMFAKPLRTIDHKGIKAVLEDLRAAIEEQQATLLLIGMPWAIDGSETPMTLDAQAFVEEVRAAIGIAVATWDERYSSSEAEAELKNLGYSWQESKALRDAMAAAMILKSWLEAHS
jgi:putative Holliday junction resolvase